MHRRNLILAESDAWALQQTIKDMLPGTEGQKETIPYAKEFRQKLNDVIVRFDDEEELEQDEIEVSDEEIWLIDRYLPMGSYKGAKQLLTQCFRILYESRLGIRVATHAEMKDIMKVKKVEEV